MSDPIPDPVYVRYIGPGTSFQIRWVLPPYRVMTEAEHGVPVAIGADAAEALVSDGPFEYVDPVEAADEILAEDQRRDAEQAAWEERQANARQRSQQRRALIEIEAGRIEAMRIAAGAERDAGGSQSDIVAAAATAEHEYRAGLTALGAEGR